MSTGLVYLEQMHVLEADAYIERVDTVDGRAVVYLDRTILYPQGGGQPYDFGKIQSEDSLFIVEEVRFVDGEVRHIGHFEGPPFHRGEGVHITVDGGRRHLNARLHSAGHLVDMAVSQLRENWTPLKGYHFPDSPKVEYDGPLEDTEKDGLTTEITQLANEYITQDLPVSCRFVDRSELESICRHVPDTLPTNKPIRVVAFNGFAIPCGGTHVASLKELRGLSITKLKKKDGHIVVGYDIPR